MKLIYFLLVNLMILQCISTSTATGDFDFFYFVQQWPGSFCETNRSCCFPSTGKPASNFSIHGLWPNYKNGSYPEFCNPSNPFNQTQISDLISRMQNNWPSLSCPNANNTKFWAHEWDKHGTCSESILNQHCYFEVTLNLKEKLDLLQILKNAGIQPDGRSYRLKRVKKAIRKGTGFAPVIECNVDPSGNSQLFEIYLCVNKSGSKFIRCPKPSKSSCNSTIEFPVF